MCVCVCVCVCGEQNLPELGLTYGRWCEMLRSEGFGQGLECQAWGASQGSREIPGRLVAEGPSLK